MIFVTVFSYLFLDGGQKRYTTGNTAGGEAVCHSRKRRKSKRSQIISKLLGVRGGPGGVSLGLLGVWGGLPVAISVSNGSSVDRLGVSPSAKIDSGPVLERSGSGKAVPEQKKRVRGRSGSPGVDRQPIHRWALRAKNLRFCLYDS